MAGPAVVLGLVSHGPHGCSRGDDMAWVEGRWRGQMEGTGGLMSSHPPLQDAGRIPSEAMA